ncbi:ABC transporter permease [Planobispora takensis]|uniref:Autoinducer 2 import system permease protein LsrC n=1 Tax=Planobispora takensis TaxID=1367882 RepID=A0A8J3T5H9_9ACTN|nr:ABC transporter permease [Planobispora takensis]GII01369.1 sugar ABC transporter permease [Planobispora takensis]
MSGPETGLAAPDAGSAASPVPPAPRGDRLVSRVARVRELGIVAALGLLFGFTGVVNPAFLSFDSLRDILLNSSIVAMLAVGQTLVVVTRNVDLSVSSVVGLSAFGGALIMADNPGVPVPLVIAGCVLLGALCGAINGLLVGVAGVPALVATLGTLYTFRGIDYAWAGGRQVNAADMPGGFLSLGSASVLGLPLLALVALAVVLVVGWMLRNLPAGRELYAIGSSPEAAVLAGIRVRRRIIAAFVANGALAGLAGVMWAARFGTVDATVATGKELDVIAAVVVGGVAIFGGSGTVYGAALGAVLLASITSALAVLRVDALAQTAISGALIIAAIVLDRLLALRVAAALRRRRYRDAT